MRRAFLVLAVLAAAAGMLTGCRQSDTQGKDIYDTPAGRATVRDREVRQAVPPTHEVPRTNVH